MSIEKRISELLVDTLLKENLISVNEGEETTVEKSQDRKQILDALETTEADTLFVYRPNGKRIGHFWLIWGNGRDLISDYGYVCNHAERYMDEVVGLIDWTIGDAE